MGRKAAGPTTTIQQRGKEIIKALQSFEEAKGLSVEVVIEVLKESLVSAYQKETDKDALARVDVDINTGAIALYNLKEVVTEVEDDLLQISLEEVKALEPEKDIKLGDFYEIPVSIDNFMRATAMQVKAVLKQKIREAEKDAIYNEYILKKDEIITGVVERISEKFILVNLGRVISMMPIAYMIPGERYKVGDVIRVYVVDVVKNAKNASPVVISRNDPNFLKRIMEKEISEIYDGTVEIRSIAREAGDRSKIAVSSNKPNIDPTGACIGPKGVRIQSISQQLLGEKIDVIQYNDIPELYVAESLKPAVVYGLAVNQEDKSMIAIVANEDFSHAIGKRGQNVRLAVKLTGWRIDVKTVDEALSQSLQFKTLTEINLNIERLQKQAVVEPKVEVAPVEEIIPEAVEEIPSVVEEKVVEEATPQIKITTSIYESNIPYNATSALEERKSIEELAATIQKQAQTVKTPSRTTSKPFTKPTFKTEEKPVEPEKKDDNKNYMPVYSEDELMDLETEEEEESKYDDEVDYDDYDEYYEED